MSRSAERNAWRKAVRIGALCTCCSRVDIAAVYRRALPFVHQVDHALPLALGGAHCVRNLLILTRDEHAAKTRHDAAVRARVKRDAALSLHPQRRLDLDL